MLTRIELHAIASFCDTKSNNIAFRGVWVDSEERTITATDGHFLCRVTDVENMCGYTGFVPMDTWWLAAKNATRKTPFVLGKDSMCGKHIPVLVNPAKKPNFERVLKEWEDRCKQEAPGFAPFLSPRCAMLLDYINRALGSSNSTWWLPTNTPYGGVFVENFKDEQPERFKMVMAGYSPVIGNPGIVGWTKNAGQ